MCELQMHVCSYTDSELDRKTCLTGLNHTFAIQMCCLKGAGTCLGLNFGLLGLTYGTITCLTCLTRRQTVGSCGEHQRRGALGDYPMDIMSDLNRVDSGRFVVSRPCPVRFLIVKIPI